MCHVCGTILERNYRLMNAARSRVSTHRMNHGWRSASALLSLTTLLAGAACDRSSPRDGAFAIVTPDGYSLAMASGTGTASVTANGVATSASAHAPQPLWYGAPSGYAYSGWGGAGFASAGGAIVAPIGGWYPFVYSSPLWSAPVPQVVPMAQPQLSPHTLTPYLVPPR
jgi:hypothetical protein